MPTQRRYKEYFDIDKEFYKCVDEENFKASPTHWLKFYPHAKFITLLKDVASILDGEKKQSVWMEGAYGTGKSYAVLTLKKLLDSSVEELEHYFNYYGLPQDLLGRYKNLKRTGKILTVFRERSGNILTDRDLIVAIQESVRSILIEKGLGGGEDALKDKGIEWLSVERNKELFQRIIDEDERVRLTGRKVDALIAEIANSPDREYVINLIKKVDELGRENNINIFQPDIKALIEWIKGVMKDNALTAIVFIWDEFTEFFKNNKNRLTDFQAIINMSNLTPFYLIPVTHESGNLFADSDQDRKKILDRFVSPTVRIELPDGIAFELIGAALHKTENALLQKEWASIAENLNGDVKNAREKVAKAVGTTTEKMKEILPLHPYAALVLKYLAEKFQSNQRSMFDFIKADHGDDTKAFQWFIQNNGPFGFGSGGSDKFLTIDFLWDFFYEKGKSDLSPEIRSVLDAYNRNKAQSLNNDQTKVFKTILMLIATSKTVGDDKDFILLPNETTLSLAFSGTELGEYSACNIADRLADEKIIYKRQISSGKFIYSVATEQADEGEIEQIKEDLRKSKKTANLASEGGLPEVFALRPSLSLRFCVEIATVDDVTSKVNGIYNAIGKCKNQIPVLLCFARDDKESAALYKKIDEINKRDVPSGSTPIVFVDMSHTQLANAQWERYLDAKAREQYWRGKSPEDERTAANTVKDILSQWKDALKRADYSIWYQPFNLLNIRAANADDLQDHLFIIDKRAYPLALEVNGFDAHPNLWTSTQQVKQGAQCGIGEQVGGTFRNANRPTENTLAGAWKVANYWTVNPNLTISKFKTFIDKIIKQELEVLGEIGIGYLYEKLQNPPYGLMNCNLTAFVLGFLLKEYTANEGEYYCTDSMGHDVPLTTEKLKELISDVINPPSRCQERYIKAKSRQETAFAEATSKIFGLNTSSCFAGKVRDGIRAKTKSYGFPLWCLSEIVQDECSSVNEDIIRNLIAKYVGVLNMQNYNGSHINEIELIKGIGQIFIDNPSAIEDLSRLVKKPENFMHGMKAYIVQYEGGRLKELAEKLGVGDKYIAALKHKFQRTEDSNWVWNHETAEKQINAVITEYEVIDRSKDFNIHADSFEGLIIEWIEALKLLRVSFDAARSVIADGHPLFEALVSLRKTETTHDPAKFLSLLTEHSQSFKRFFEGQQIVFKQVASVWLGGLSDAQKDSVFSRLPSDTFALNKADWLRDTEEVIIRYKQTLGREKLRTLWREKTGTEKPYEWSQRFFTPVIAMAPVEETAQAKKAFDVVNAESPDDTEAETALVYLEHISWWEKLSSETERDAALARSVSKDYSRLLTAKEVREYLTTNSNEAAYYWWSNDTVRATLTQLAQTRYDMSGVTKALAIIDKINDPEKIKEYLRNLVKGSMAVGLEIIADAEE
jgi:hypothetical protein